jgi:hypothetical protein
MCTYIADGHDVTATAYMYGEWIDVTRAVVSVDHPYKVPVEHALCLDFRTDDPARRLAVELHPDDARQLAYSILDALQR